MTSTVRPADVTPAGTDPMRRTARVAGILYLLTFVAVLTVALYGPVREDADFVLGAGSEAPVLWGALCEVVVALACAGTAVVLFPVLRRRSETAAVGYLASRLVEAALILVGVATLLTLVGLRDEVAAADGNTIFTTGRVLVGFYDSVFLLSQSLMPVFNALFLGYVLYRTRLVPRVLPVLGLVGAPLLLASDVAILFGVLDRVAPIAALAALPIAVWEFSLGVYLIVKGFRPSAVAVLRGTAGSAP